MRRAVAALLLGCVLAGCSRKIEVQSNTSWTGMINHADVAGCGDQTFELEPNSPGFVFTKQTVDGYLGVHFVRGHGDEPVTTAPYGSVWGSAW